MTNVPRHTWTRCDNNLQWSKYRDMRRRSLEMWHIRTADTDWRCPWRNGRSNVVWMYSCLWKRANRQSVYGDTCVDVSTARRCARTVKCDIVTTTNLHDHPRSLTSQQTVAALGLMTFYCTRCTAANWHPVASFPQVEGTPQGIQLRVWPCGANSCACLVAGGDQISFSTVATASPALASVCGIAVVTT